MIYHNTSLRAPLRRPVRDFPPEPQNHTPYPLKTAQNGADDFWGRESLCSRLPGVRFQCDPILNCQKTKNMTFTKTVNGQAIYCRIVKRWRGIGAQPWPGDQRGWNPFARTPIRDRARSVLYIHRVALLPLNLRTVSPIYGETSMRVAFIFGFINSDLKAS